MKVAPLKRQPRMASTACQIVGTVVAAGHPLSIETDVGTIEAHRAASCIMECAPGDNVLICVTDDDEAYVLAILTRDEASPVVFSTAGDLNIELPNGKMCLRANDGLALASPGEISLTAYQLNLAAARGAASLGEASIVGKKLSAHIETISMFARMISSTFGTVYERLTRGFRKVEELQQVQAGQLDLQARDNLALHARNTMMTADKLVKLDGAQIHLG